MSNIESIDSGHGSGANSQKTGTKLRSQSRASSIDSQRSLNNAMDVENESDLLQSDDEEATEKIELLSNDIENPKLRKTVSVNTKPAQKVGKAISSGTGAQNVSNSAIMKTLLEMKDAMYTKKDGIALKKAVDVKITAIQSELKAHNDRFSGIDDRIQRLERKLVSADYERELAKQQALKNNISIFGCPKYDEEEVSTTAIKIFKAFGIEFNASDFSAVYRSTGTKNLSSIIVKFKDFEKKLQAINTKPGQKEIKVSDIIGATQVNARIYINNHVTPFFGRLLAAGRQAVKEEVIHSCWIGTTGCLVKLQENGKPLNVRSIDDFVTLRVKTGKPPADKKRNKPDDQSSPKEKQEKKRNRK